MSDKTELGYTHPLFILPFDHRSSFVKKMFSLSGGLAKDQTAMVVAAKQLIFQGFKKGVAMGVPVENAAILVDEQFGDAILREAFVSGYKVLLATEKSGQDEYDFEYGRNFAEHIEKYKPTFAKALIRYNPEGDKELNKRQAARLKILSDFSHENGYKFLIEPLVPATEQQLKQAGGDQKKYDAELRPELMVQMVGQLQSAGVEPDVWKIEGFEDPKHYAAVIKQARAEGRENVGAIVLGRGADMAQVEKWLKAGAGVPGVIGFAVGRTIFWDALVAARDKKIDEVQAVEQIAKNYLHFYRVFIEAQDKG